MDARENFCTASQQYRFFNHYSHSTAALYSKTKTPFNKFDCMKCVVMDAPKTGKATRTRAKSLALETMGGDSSELLSIFDEDLDLKSDAKSSYCRLVDAVDVVDNEECIDELFYHKGARKKLKLLAGMVGADNTESGFVLAKVVTVLKDLKRRTGAMDISESNFV